MTGDSSFEVGALGVHARRKLELSSRLEYLNDSLCLAEHRSSDTWGAPEREECAKSFRTNEQNRAHPTCIRPARITTQVESPNEKLRHRWNCRWREENDVAQRERMSRSIMAAAAATASRGDDVFKKNHDVNR